MDDIARYEVYHVTDESNANDIIDGSFEYNKKATHWLGQGFYFFLDISLAKDWALKKFKGYGNVEKPVYIKCTVNIDKEHLLDLRFLEDYNFTKLCFDKFIKSVCGKYDFKNTDYKKFRTLFFDYIKKTYKIHCVVAYFSERNGLSNIITHNYEFDKIKIPYIEIQMCLNRNEYIVSKEVVDV